MDPSLDLVAPEPVEAGGRTPARGSQWQQLRALRPYMRPYRARLLAAVLATALSGLLGLGFPWVLGTLVDSALAGDGDIGDLNLSAALLAGIFMAQAALARVRIWNLAYAGQHIVNDLRSVLFNRMIRFPTAELDRTTTGRLSSRLISDAAFAYGSVSGAVPQLVYSAIVVVGGVILLLVVDWRLALVVLLVIPVAAIVARSYSRRVQRLSRGYQNGLAATNALAADSLGAARTIKWFGAESLVAGMYHRGSRTVIEQGLERGRVRAFWTPTMMLLASVSVVAVLWLGGRSVQSGAMTAGALVSFLLYARFVADGLSSLVTQYSKLAQGLGATERIFSLLDRDTEAVPGGNAVRGATVSIADRRGSVEFRNVSFGYHSRDTAALDHVSFAVPAGTTVALVGASGAGKSTVTHLLARLYDATQGTVLVDGVDVREQDLAELRSCMAIVPQDIQLLSGTVADNIRLGRRNASRDDVRAAAEVANAVEFIESLPRGFGTEVGERGSALSGGQRQRIAIARALLADPRLLILDEATNALDAHNEELVTQALRRLMAGRTNIVIAHRLSTVKQADTVLVMHEGQIIESGTPADLLRSPSRFAEMAHLQSLSHVLDVTTSVPLPGD